MQPRAGPSYPLRFTVASALLRELGERLVGRAHIALAELIKNAYDADASQVELRMMENTIEIRDNGHGMTAEEFERFWMRIGSPHKQVQRFSPRLHRPMTGSKGVGRLAVQFLARKIFIFTVSEHDPALGLCARVDWERAVAAGDLTVAEARVRATEAAAPSPRFPAGRCHGTVIRLRGLNHRWDADDITDLAREVWWMQPPFRQSSGAEGFRVNLIGTDPDLEAAFERQIVAVLDLWHARLLGRIVDGAAPPEVELALEFTDGTKSVARYPLPEPPLHHLSFEIRVFHLQHRQRHGIEVAKAREYLNKFGGVGVYDGGFRLPYYGVAEDWLGIELDHAHRLHRSELLPEGLQVSKGLQFLPTNSRLFGSVEVDTGLEQTHSDHPDRRLLIQVSRDRLVPNAAFRSLQKAVRWALDFYAMQEARRQFAEKAARPTPRPGESLGRIANALAEYSDRVPAVVLKQITESVREAAQVTDALEEVTAARTGLLGALATAGITALAYQHEIGQQFHSLESVVTRLHQVAAATGDTTIDSLVKEIERWLERARATRELFAPLMQAGSREQRQRFRAQALCRDVWRRMGALTRGVQLDSAGLDPEIRLPTGTYVEWAAIFQNILLNAVNATLDADRKVVAAKTTEGAGRILLLIQDTGVGVDLANAETLFEPFERRLKLSPERQALALGGTGLGLTIVRMLLDSLGSRVRFVAPDPSFSTAVEISWSK